jgi:hypothetical protein
MLTRRLDRISKHIMARDVLKAAKSASNAVAVHKVGILLIPMVVLSISNF